MEAVEMVWGIVGELYKEFAKVRTSDEWTDQVVPSVANWVTEQA
jgi:hypothetical protein